MEIMILEWQNLLNLLYGSSLVHLLSDLASDLESFFLEDLIEFMMVYFFFERILEDEVLPFKLITEFIAC